MARWSLLLRGCEDTIKKRDIKSISAPVGCVTKEAWVWIPFRDDRSNRGPNIVLNRLNVGCSTSHETFTFSYFLSVRRKNRVRFVGGSELEGGVVEAFGVIPPFEVRSSIRCSASVALSSCSPVTGPDKTKNR